MYIPNLGPDVHAGAAAAHALDALDLHLFGEEKWGRFAEGVGQFLCF